MALYQNSLALNPYNAIKCSHSGDFLYEWTPVSVQAFDDSEEKKKQKTQQGVWPGRSAAVAFN